MDGGKETHQSKADKLTRGVAPHPQHGNAASGKSPFRATAGCGGESGKIGKKRGAACYILEAFTPQVSLVFYGEILLHCLTQAHYMQDASSNPRLPLSHQANGQEKCLSEGTSRELQSKQLLLARKSRNVPCWGGYSWPDLLLPDQCTRASMLGRTPQRYEFD